MNSLKQMEKTPVIIDDDIFYISPFPAFKAANISADLAKLIGPFVASIAPAAAGGVADTEGDLSIDSFDIGKVDMDDAVPALANAFSSLSGNEFERLIRKLLTDSGNISVKGAVTGGAAELLSYDLANEVFCGNVQNMFILCYHVIKLNFSGFFGKIRSRFGNRGAEAAPEEKTNTENLMGAGSAI